MPEGPEVKLFVDKLNNNFRYFMIKSVEILSGRYIKKPIQNLELLKIKTSGFLEKTSRKMKLF